jgi:hypothetical protein
VVSMASSPRRVTGASIKGLAAICSSTTHRAGRFFSQAGVNPQDGCQADLGAPAGSCRFSWLSMRVFLAHK